MPSPKLSPNESDDAKQPARKMEQEQVDSEDDDNTDSKDEDDHDLRRFIPESCSPQSLNKNKERPHSNIGNSAKDDTKKSYGSFLLYGVGIASAIAFVAVFYRLCIWNDGSFETKPISYNEQFVRDLKSILLRFPSQGNDLVLTFCAGMEKTDKGEGPSVFLLLNEGDKKIGECLLKHVANATKGFFRTNYEPLWLKGSEIKSQLTDDPSKFVDYQYQIDYKIVTVITGLEEIPGEIARYFHSFCDTYNPIVKRAVYFFLLDEGAMGGSKFTKPGEKAFDLLTKAWSRHLPNEILSPLITRMTDNVLTIKPESSFHECSI